MIEWIQLQQVTQQQVSPEVRVIQPQQLASGFQSALIPSERKDPQSQEAHLKLIQKAKAQPIDIYFLGDSITRRWGCDDEAYKHLRKNWDENFKDYKVADFGWGGDQIQNILWRIENGELDNVNPKIIVLMAGTNNVGKEQITDEKITDIISGIDHLIKTCQKKAPGSTIILTGITPRNDSVFAMPAITKINSQLKKLGDEKSIHFVNLNKQMADESGKLYNGITYDKLHLDVKGYQIWADSIKPIFAKVLGKTAN